jgi:hypothetical protein
MKEQFLQWQYAELCKRLEKAYDQKETPELIDLIAAMLEEKERMETEYELLYGVRPPPIPPPPPPWWG